MSAPTSPGPAIKAAFEAHNAMLDHLAREAFEAHEQYVSARAPFPARRWWDDLRGAERSAWYAVVRRVLAEAGS